MPYIGIIAFGMAMLGFFGKVKLPFGLPTGFMSWDVLTDAFSGVSLSIPLPAFNHLFDGFRSLFGGIEGVETAPILIAALPLGISNAIGTLNNVESAAAAGDEYPEFEALLSDGAMTLVDAALG